jgi:hypothetical protein
MSSSRSNISPSGTIINFLSLGFTLKDANMELVDNSLDAQAVNVRIRLDTTTKTLYVDDDGHGMDITQLTGALCINNVRPASENIGLRGLGGKAAHCVLSNEEFPTIIVSKTASSSRCEIDADWPGAVRNDVWDPRASRGSEEYKPLWESGCLNPSHGTTTKIPMPESKFNDLVGSLPCLLKELARTYEAFLETGRKIVVEIDGVAQPLDNNTCLGWSGTPAHLRNEVPLTVLRKPATGEVRVYYRHESMKPVWTDMVRFNPNTDAKPAMLRDYQPSLDDGFVQIDSMTLQSTYRPEWNPPEADGVRPAYIPGYIAPCRDKRFLQPIKSEFASSGDYEARRLRSSARHGLAFSHTADDLIGVQVNKSALTPENINPVLLDTVQRLAKKWANEIYKTHFKVGRNNPNAEFEKGLKRRMKQLRELAMANQDGFFTEFDEILEDLRERLDAYEYVEDDEEEN